MASIILDFHFHFLQTLFQHSWMFSWFLVIICNFGHILGSVELLSSFCIFQRLSPFLFSWLSLWPLVFVLFHHYSITYRFSVLQFCRFVFVVVYLLLVAWLFCLFKTTIKRWTPILGHNIVNICEKTITILRRGGCMCDSAVIPWIPFCQTCQLCIATILLLIPVFVKKNPQNISCFSWFLFRFLSINVSDISVS